MKCKCYSNVFLANHIGKLLVSLLFVLVVTESRANKKTFTALQVQLITYLQDETFLSDLQQQR